MSKSANVKNEKVERKTINAVVSHEFKEAFDSWSEQQGWSTATALRYLSEKAVGMNPTPPTNEDTTERYILSTAVEVPVKSAIDSLEDGKVNVAQWLREIAANACGYDLSAEPERVRGSSGAKAALEKERERTNSQATVLLGLRKYMTPSQFVEALSDAGKSITDIGLTDDDITDEAFAALR